MVETTRHFAAVSDSVDLRDIYTIRRPYIESLDNMGRSLDKLIEDKQLFGKMVS